MNDNLDVYLKELYLIDDKVKKIKSLLLFIDKYRAQLQEVLNRDKQRFKEEVFEVFVGKIPDNIRDIDKVIDQNNGIKEIVQSQTISEQFTEYLNKHLLHNNWEAFYYLKDNPYKRILDLEEALKNNHIFEQTQYTTLDILKEFIQNYDSVMKVLIEKVTSMYIFNQIQLIKDNVVIIGPNGSGKSTFARYLEGQISDNVTIISAQHLLVYSNPNTINIQRDSISKVRDYQRLPKLEFDNHSVRDLTEDLGNLMLALFQDKIAKATTFYETEQDKEMSILDQTIETWQKLISHRKLIHNGEYGIHVETPEGKEYDFNKLSDGEKTIFYFIGHILLAQDNSYIIIDEPENHLNLSICIKLWDTLEKIRTDCKFVYITHNLDFAISRNEKTLLWNKNFYPPFNWDFQIIKKESEIPDRLLIEVMGSRKPVLFCEGDDRNSLDFKIYNAVLGEKYNIIPVGGHEMVKNYTIAFNKNQQISRVIAYGIIDGDSWSETEIIKYEENNILVLPFNEIENIICSEVFLKKIIEICGRNPDDLEKFKRELLSYTKNKKIELSVWYANNKVNNYLKSNLFKETKSIGNLKEEMKELKLLEVIDKYYNQMLEQLEKDLKEKNVDNLMKYVNYKKYGSRELANRFIISDYEETFVRLLHSNVELKRLFMAEIVEPYFRLLN